MRKNILLSLLLAASFACGGPTQTEVSPTISGKADNFDELFVEGGPIQSVLGAYQEDGDWTQVFGGTRILLIPANTLSTILAKGKAAQNGIFLLLAGGPNRKTALLPDGTPT